MLHQNSSHTKNHKTSLLLHKYKTYYSNTTAASNSPTVTAASSNTTAHAAQLPNPHPRYAAISNDFSIKNSSCSPTAKSPPSVCSYFQRLFYQKQLMQPNCQIPTLGMQLFPVTRSPTVKTLPFYV
jgi:hypothetical protein